MQLNGITLKKPLFQKRRWSCDFPPRKTRVAQKHRAISRQKKMVFSTPVGLSWHSPPPPRVCADGRMTYGRTDERSRDYYVTTKISRLDRLLNFLSNGAPLAGFARRLRYDAQAVRDRVFRYVRITFPVANARYRFSNLNWVVVFDRCNNVPGHAIVGKAAQLTGHFCPCTGRVSVICHAGEVSNFNCKLTGRRKGGHRLERKARWAPK